MVSVTPCWISGLGLAITGMRVFTGGPAIAAVVMVERAVPEPTALVAVTSTARPWPWSALATR